MDIIENKITQLINKYKVTPYLFIGSGLSMRYLGLETWEGLLKKFCGNVRPYDYYRTKHNGNLPQIAKTISIDYNEMIWSDNGIESTKFKKDFLPFLLSNSSALKIAISEYLKDKDIQQIKSSYSDEIENLKKVSIEGIITTNWDILLETLFPNFHVIIGQDELLSSNSIGVGEIFKIHGCSTKPDSLVLTEDDYKDFNQRYAYLAAKLVTYFVEHPVIFIGYSLTDENVTEILTSIVNCLSKSEIERLAHNFIFVQRAKNEEIIREDTKEIGGAHIPITVIELEDFSKLYRPLSKIERKIPLRILRYLKTQVYELAQSQDSLKKVAVIDIDDSTNVDNLEIVVGVGIIKRLGNIGYNKIKANDIIKEVLFDHKQYDAKQILESTFPETKGFVPIHYFVSQLPNFDNSSLKKNALKNYNKEMRDFKTNMYLSQFNNNFSILSLSEIFQNSDYDKVMKVIPFYDFRNNIDEIDLFRDFLKQNYIHYFRNGEDIGGGGTTFFRKAVCLYDYLKYANKSRI